MYGSGGGGGSSYAKSGYTIATNNQGVQSGNGVLYITLFCQAGYYLSGTSCLVCVAGTYTSNSGSSSCTSCAAGSVTNALIRASSCTPCPAGTYSASSQVACQGCAPGFYTSNSNSGLSYSTCQPCAAGYVTNMLTETGATSCTICIAGKYSASSQEACQSCPLGTYSSSSGQTLSSTCQLCAAGRHTQNQKYTKANIHR